MTHHIPNAAENDRTYRHWHRSRDNHNVEWLTLDMADRQVNILTAEVLTELLFRLEETANARPRGLALRSAKPAGFTVGADVSEFHGMTDLADVTAKVRRAHAVADLLEKFPAPTAIVVHGTCVGGGLELALCCDYRVALPDVQLGFPEVFLGLHPGMGGTFRSVRLLDPIDAMTMMITGKNKTAQQARRSGGVDTVVDPDQAAAAVRSAFSGRLKRNRRRIASIRSQLLNTGPVRRMIAKQMRAKTRKKVRPDHYPAPFALIDLWETHGGDPAAMQSAEIASFSELLIGQTAQNLVRLFFIRQKMKRLGLAVHPVHDVHSVHNDAPPDGGGTTTAYLVHQALTPCRQEARQMITEGVSPETINQAARHFGMTTDPVPPNQTPKTPASSAPSGPEVTDRLILPIVNASVRLLREGATDDPDIIDGALVLGGGFAPFRGGPIRYATQRGTDDIRKTLARLAGRHGERFQPDEGWDRF